MYTAWRDRLHNNTVHWTVHWTVHRLGWTVHCPLDCPVDSVKIYCPPCKISENARFCEIARDTAVWIE